MDPLIRWFSVTKGVKCERLWGERKRKEGHANTIQGNLFDHSLHRVLLSGHVSNERVYGCVSPGQSLKMKGKSASASFSLTLLASGSAFEESLWPKGVWEKWKSWLAWITRAAFKVTYGREEFILFSLGIEADVHRYKEQHWESAREKERDWRIFDWSGQLQSQLLLNRNWQSYTFFLQFLEAKGVLFSSFTTQMPIQRINRFVWIPVASLAEYDIYLGVKDGQAKWHKVQMILGIKRK